MDILNLTQHNPTLDQREAGVREPANTDKDAVKALLTFGEIPSREEIIRRANELAKIALDERATSAMIAGAPYLMGPLENSLRMLGIHPLFAFSVRESIERTEKDGSVTKTNVFRHVGFVG